jgi:2-dehydro-3-deoxyglucarate aldolase
MKKTQFGSWITFYNPSVAEIMADASFDWLCIDMEHSVTDYFEAQQLIMAIQSKGIKAFVRFGENNQRIIKRILDAGADGIIVPSVNSVADVVKAVQSVKYPPIGTRGVGLARAQSYGFGFEEYKDGKAKEITLIAQIEHINAINDFEAIINIEGIDGTFIGPYDFSGSMGKSGIWDDDVKKAPTHYETIAKKYEKWIGFHVIRADINLIKEKSAKVYNFIAFILDVLFLGSKIREQLSALNLKQLIYENYWNYSRQACI